MTFTTKELAKFMGVSERTFYRRLAEIAKKNKKRKKKKSIYKYGERAALKIAKKLDFEFSIKQYLTQQKPAA